MTLSIVTPLIPEGAAPMPVLVALGSFATTLLGGVAALRIGDRRHLVLGLAAGLMLGVVLFDLLPEALGEQPARLFGVPEVMLATMAGFLALHVIERSAPVTGATASQASRVSARRRLLPYNEVIV